MFGVDCTAITVEQACPAEEPCTVPQSGQRDALVCRRSQQVAELLVRLQFCSVAAADDQQIQVVDRSRIEACIRADHQPQVADDFCVTQAERA
ncbi:hypothetical protein D3C87_1861250 [compost metagenome]